MAHGKPWRIHASAELIRTGDMLFRVLGRRCGRVGFEACDLAFDLGHRLLGGLETRFEVSYPRLIVGVALGWLGVGRSRDRGWFQRHRLTLGDQPPLLPTRLGQHVAPDEILPYHRLDRGSDRREYEHEGGENRQDRRNARIASLKANAEATSQKGKSNLGEIGDLRRNRVVGFC